MKKIFLFLLCVSSLTGRSQTMGWFYSNPGSADGYVLFAPGENDSTYLIDKCGKRIHTWHSNYHPGLSVYLTPDGSLLRCGKVGNNQFLVGGNGGIIERFDWNSNLLWSYLISDSLQCQHHDAIQLPNGNIIAIVWETISMEDAQNNGRTSVGNKMWSDKLVEVHPVGTDSGVIVWQWRAWDHLIQDVDTTKLNYGVVAEHPELINVNIGQLNNSVFDWLHINSLDYDSVHDQLLVSVHNLSEVFILDHSTSMAEAAGHTGGNSGHGGDILYRWGNPQNYGRGTIDDQRLFQQHDPSWITQGLPGAGKILLFNNGIGRPGDDYSTAETFSPPTMVNNNYPIDPDSAYLPAAQDWIYEANPPTSLFCHNQGGAQRLYNGNTLICDADNGRFLEVDSSGNDFWKYINPVGQIIATQGGSPGINDCFRVTFLPSQYPGLAGQVLTPGAPIELDPLIYSCDNFPTEVALLNHNELNLTCYPNPFKNSFDIHVPAAVSNAKLQVHDVTGRLIYEEKNFFSNPQSDVSISLPEYKGVLIVSVKDIAGNYLWNVTAVAE